MWFGAATLAYTIVDRIHTCDSRRVEIEGYFVTYFDPIAGLEGLIRPLCELVRCLYSYETCMSPALNN